MFPVLGIGRSSVYSPQIRLTIGGVQYDSGDVYDAGEANLGSTETITVVVENIGDANLVLENPTASGATAGNWTSLTVVPGSTASFDLELDTSEEGLQSSSFSFASTALPSPYTVFVDYEVEDAAPEAAVIGNSVEIADADASPSALDHTDFGSTPFGTTVSRTFTISNEDGTAPLEVEVSVPSGYTLTAAPTSPVPAGDTTTFTVRCNAASVGVLSGDVSIVTNDDDENPYTFAITCTVTETLDHYIDTTVTPALDLKMAATSGTTEVNRGTAGAAANATISGATLAQTIGTQPAFDFDGVDDNLSVPNVASLANLTTQRWAFLVNADGYGEGSVGAFFCWGNSSINNTMRFGGVNGVLHASVNAATTDATATSNNGEAAFTGQNVWVFMDYDDANALGNGRKIRLWKYVAGGALTQLTLATDTAAVGTVTAPVDSLFIGNRQNLGITFDGKIGRTLAGAGLWTTTLMNQIISLSGI